MDEIKQIGDTQYQLYTYYLKGHFVSEQWKEILE